MRTKTPSKVTTLLRVLAKRADGYHEIAIGLVPVSLFDELIFSPGPPGVTLEVEGCQPLGPVSENLVHRAALAFAAATGSALALHIHLKKNIPTGAGLGGGSGNAAGTLVTLNAMAGGPLAPGGLAALALKLGSDVPFFLEPRPALAGGRGERLQPMAGFPHLALLIVYPGFPVSTAEAYGAVRPNPAPRPAPCWGSLGEVVAGLENDFEPPLLEKFPELERVKRALLGAGAAGALLSGSGSAVFGLFATAAARDAAAETLSGVPDWRLLACHTLSAHRYLD